MNPKLVLNWFKTCLEPVLNRFGSSFNIKSKMQNFKTCFKLVLNQFFSVATFLATFSEKLVIFMSTFLAALSDTIYLSEGRCVGFSQLPKFISPFV